MFQIVAVAGEFTYSCQLSDEQVLTVIPIHHHLILKLKSSAMSFVASVRYGMRKIWEYTFASFRKCLSGYSHALARVDSCAPDPDIRSQRIELPMQVVA